MTEEITGVIFGVWFLIGAALVFWMQAGFPFNYIVTPCKSQVINHKSLVISDCYWCCLERF